MGLKILIGIGVFLAVAIAIAILIEQWEEPLHREFKIKEWEGRNSKEDI